MKKNTKTTIKNFYIRAADIDTKDDDKKTIKGIIPYNVNSVDMCGIIERITPTAFNKTLSDKSEVKCLFGHDVTKILGSSTAGTLRMESQKDGLHFEVDLPSTVTGQDAYELINRGDCTTLSFGFIPIKWKDTQKDDNTFIRELVEVKLLEISVCVAFPAYPDGLTSVRNIIDSCESTLSEITNILDNEKNLSDEEKEKLSELAKKIKELADKTAETIQSSKDTEQDTDKEQEKNSADVEKDKDEEVEDEQTEEPAEEENTDSDETDEEKEKEEANKRSRYAFYYQQMEI